MTRLRIVRADQKATGQPFDSFAGCRFGQPINLRLHHAALNFELSFLQIIIGVSATQVIGVLPFQPLAASAVMRRAGLRASSLPV